MIRRNFILLIGLLIIVIQLPAQKAKYGDMNGGYDCRIPEHTGSNMHVWTASAQPVFGDFTNTTLTLHVFSSDMRMLAETKVPLGKIRTWNLDFKNTDSGYYAHIFYASDVRSRIILHIDFDGKMTDVSEHYGAWSKPADTVQQVNKIYAMLNTGVKLFLVKTAGNDGTGDAGADTSHIISIDGAAMKNNKTNQQLFIRRVVIKNQATVEKIYGSAALSFNYPFIHVTDTGILAGAFTEKESTDEHSKTPPGSFMFLTKLDTGLNSSGQNFALIKIADKAASERYSPTAMYFLGKHLFLVNNGWNAADTRSVAIIPSFAFPSPPVFKTSLIHSLRIIGIDEKNKLIRDTVIENQASGIRINWQNYFVTASGSSIDFFLSSQYRGSKNGITHLSIDSNGNMKEEDLIVDVRHEYLLSRAKKLEPGILVVPFEKRGKVTGIMRLTYEE